MFITSAPGLKGPDSFHVRTMRFLLCLFSCLVLVGCQRVDPEADMAKVAVLTLLAESGEILFIEHQAPADSGLSQTDSVDASLGVYRLARLEPRQIKALRLEVGSAFAPVHDVLPACMPTPHHTLVARDMVGQESRIQICFECGQIVFSDGRWVYAPEVVDAIGRATSVLGFQRSRDWSALANAAG